MSLDVLLNVLYIFLKLPNYSIIVKIFVILNRDGLWLEVSLPRSIGVKIQDSVLSATFNPIAYAFNHYILRVLLNYLPIQLVSNRVGHGVSALKSQHC